MANRNQEADRLQAVIDQRVAQEVALRVDKKLISDEDVPCSISLEGDYVTVNRGKDEFVFNMRNGVGADVEEEKKAAPVKAASKPATKSVASKKKK